MSVKRFALLLTALLSLTVAAVSALDMTVATPPFGDSGEQLQERWGPAAFNSEGILIYRVDVISEADETRIPADLTLWFRSSRLFFASFAFPIQGMDTDELTRHYSWISLELSRIHGDPSSTASTPGEFFTEVWNLTSVDIEHTLILRTGRLDHLLNFTATDTQR